MKETIIDLIKEHKLDTKKRKREIVYKRYYLMGVLYSMNTFTLQEIGRMFNRDHATAIYGIKQHNEWWQHKDELYLKYVHSLVEIIEPGVHALPKDFYFYCHAEGDTVTIRGSFTQKMLNQLNQTLTREELSNVFSVTK